MLIWLVEDSEADELLIRLAIGRDGLECEFRVSPDGEKAIAFLDVLDTHANQAPPQVILVDLNLPRKGGATVLERIRQSAKCAGVPVIIISSSDSATDRAQVSRLGASYFQKPLELAEFMKLGPLVRGMVTNWQPQG